MILVDSSIWIDHIRKASSRLIGLLEAELVSMHPWVVGELACGNLADRAKTLHLLRSLPRVAVATDDEVLFFIDKHGISGKGVGYLDMHLLAAAALGTLKIWTRDRRLNEIASLLGLSA
jgi:predicted nucleic acid-binding protein